MAAPCCLVVMSPHARIDKEAMERNGEGVEGIQVFLEGTFG